MRLRASSALVAAISAACAVASATECDLMALATVGLTDAYSNCVSDSGYSLEAALGNSTLEPPTSDQMLEMCASSSCMDLVDEVEDLGLGDCTIQSYSLESDIIDVLKDECEESGITPTYSPSSTVSGSVSSRSASNSASSSASSSAGISGGSGNSGSGSTQLSTGVIIAMACGGFVMLLILVGLFLVWRKLHQNKQPASSSPQPPASPPPAYNMLYDQGPNAPRPNGHQLHSAASANPYRYNTPSTAPSSEPGPSSGSHDPLPIPFKIPQDRSASVNLWDDPVIVAARIPFNGIRLVNCLSHGGHGEVYRGVYRDRYVAVKMLLFATRKDMAHINAFLSEIKLAAMLEHPNIVKFIGVAWESLSDLYSVSEYMDGGDLRSLLTEYKRAKRPCGLDATKLRIAMEVAHALTYMHSLSPMVLHRDLKSRNILLTAQLGVRVTDFGASKVRLDRTLTAGVGTSLWIAPEVVMGERYDEKADIFSFGVVLSELDTHDLPYEKARLRSQAGGEQPLPDLAVIQLMLLGKLRLEFSPGMPANVRKLAESCVEVDPAERPTAAEVAYRLNKELKAGRR